MKYKESEKTLNVFFFSKASVKRIDAKFSAWFYRGYINTKQTVWKQTPCVCIQCAVLRLAASIEDGFFYKTC